MGHLTQTLGVALSIIRAFFTRHPVAAYCALAFSLSWSYWLALIHLGYRVEPGSSATHLPGLAGPFLAAVIGTGITGGSLSVQQFLRRCFVLRQPRIQSLALALSPLAAGALVFFGMGLLGRNLPSVTEFNTYPGALPGWSLPGTVLLALLLNGLGEEGGWRGYLLPLLARRGTRLLASVSVAGIWMLWHAPLFVLNSSMSALLGPTIVGWTISLLAGSLLLAWLYFRTESILVVACWHTSFNFMVATEPGQGAVAASLSTAVMALAAIIAIQWHARQSHGDA